MGCGASSSTASLQSQVKVITESGKIFRIGVEPSLQVEAIKSKMEMLIGVKSENLRLCLHQEDGQELELSDPSFLNAFWKQINKDPILYLFQTNLTSKGQSDCLKYHSKGNKLSYKVQINDEFHDDDIHNNKYNSLIVPLHHNIHGKNNYEIEEDIEEQEEEESKPTTVMHKHQSICLGSYQQSEDIQKQESFLAALQQIDQAEQGLYLKQL